MMGLERAGMYPYPEFFDLGAFSKAGFSERGEKSGSSTIGPAGVAPGRVFM
jgi:hypothetical protein